MSSTNHTRIEGTSEHSLQSSYRENLLEHLFAGEIMRHLWCSGIKRVEMLKPQVDDGGYDLVLEANGFVRHIQLKATFNESKVSRFNINTRLAEKPSGCVVVLVFTREDLALGPFLWYGGPPGKPLPDLSVYKVAKHTKGNAQGTKLPRYNIRVLPRGDLMEVEDIPALAALLFDTRHRTI
jgi:hypothetical protein